MPVGEPDGQTGVGVHRRIRGDHRRRRLELRDGVGSVVQVLFGVQGGRKASGSPAQQQRRQNDRERQRGLEGPSAEELPRAKATGHDERKHEEKDVVQVQVVLRVVAAQRVGEVGRDRQEQPPRRQQRQREHRRDDRGQHRERIRSPKLLRDSEG